jgi:hypothetical protein
MSRYRKKCPAVRQDEKIIRPLIERQLKIPPELHAETTWEGVPFAL